MTSAKEAVISELIDRRLLNDVDSELYEEIALSVIKAATQSAPMTPTRAALERIANIFDDSWRDGSIERYVGDLAREALSSAPVADGALVQAAQEMVDYLYNEGKGWIGYSNITGRIAILGGKLRDALRANSRLAPAAEEMTTEFQQWLATPPAKPTVEDVAREIDHYAFVEKDSKEGDDYCWCGECVKTRTMEKEAAMETASRVIALFNGGADAKAE